MLTSKTFSTIDYNTTPFLISKLDDLIRRNIIDFYAFIEHIPEADENKAHKHVFITPSKRFDTSQLPPYLNEFDPNHPDKPLTCIRCDSSKFGDWYYYVLHDERYLASKGQSRKYHYKHSEIITSDCDYLNELVHTIDNSKLARFDTLVNAVNKGVSFERLVMLGQIPIQQINQYRTAFDLIASCSPSRNGRTTHTPKYDPDTGELIQDNSKNEK